MTQQTPKKGDCIVSRNTRYRVERAHKDGTVTLRAIFFQTDSGEDQPGYLGYVYPRITLADLPGYV